MTLQFDPSAYGRAYEIGQQNAEAMRQKPFEALANMAQTTGQMAQEAQQRKIAQLNQQRQNQMMQIQQQQSDIEKQRADREQKKYSDDQTPLNQLFSSNQLSQPVSSGLESLTNPDTMSQNSLSLMGQVPGQAGVSDAPQIQQPPQGRMVERFRDFLGGKMPAMQAPQTPQDQSQNPLTAIGLPAEVGSLNLADLDKLAKAKALFSKSTAQPYGATTGNLSWATATPTQQNMADAMLSGNIRASDLGMRDRATIVGLANERAIQKGVPFQSYRGDVNAGTEKYFSVGKGGQMATSLNLALGHLDGAMGAYQNLKNTDVNLLNKPINWLKENTNDPNVIALGNKLTALQGELATVFKGSAGTDQEIAHWMQYLNDKLTPEQAMAAGQSIDELLRSRLHGLNYQQSSSLNGGGRERPLLSPEAAATMKRYETPNQPASTAGMALIRDSQGGMHRIPTQNLNAARQRDPGLQVMGQ